MTADTHYLYTKVPLPEGVEDMKDVSRITFSVKACDSALIAISEGERSTLTRGHHMYEVMIGGWHNGKSMLRNKRRGKGQHRLAEKEHDPVLDCDQFRDFYLSWGDGEVRFGLAGSDSPMLVYDRSANGGDGGFPVNNVFVTGADSGADSIHWKIDFPCNKAPPTQGPTTSAPSPTQGPNTEAPSPITSAPTTTPTPGSEDCTVHVETQGHYRYQEVEVPRAVSSLRAVSSITFSIRACSNAYLVISKGALSTLDLGQNMYEIVIGGWENTKSAIRSSKQAKTELAAKVHDDDKPPLDCGEFRDFYLSWENGVVSVGSLAEGSSSPFMSYRPPGGGDKKLK